MDPLKRIVNFCHAQGTKIGIQLAHAGRKASTHAPWVQRRLPKGSPETATAEENGWPGNGTLLRALIQKQNLNRPASVVAPSEIPFHEQLYPHPKALSEQQILDIENAFIAAVDRCEKIGCSYMRIYFRQMS
jgi:2,4-dienoyl-CoA reductase-like NADH-dependent reductase (Old Yellow Enzyme family)